MQSISHPTRTIRWTLATLALATTTTTSRAVTVASPDGQVVADLRADDAGRLTLGVAARGVTALLPGAIGLSVDGKDLGVGARLGEPARSSVDEAYAVRGVHATARDHAALATFPVTSGDVAWQVELRVADDGVAYRYRAPVAARVDADRSTWRVPVGSRVWFQPLNARGDYEATFQTALPAELPERLKPRPPSSRDATRPAVLAAIAAAATQPVRNAFAAPATFRLAGGGGYVMLSIANLTEFTDLSLESLGSDGSADAFGTFFHNDANGFAWRGDVVTPWHVAIVATDLNGLVNSDLIRNCCPPPSAELAGADWIKPGRAAWEWMVTGRPLLEQQHQWIDWSRALGFEYYLIDDGWRRWRQGDKDAWACLKDVVEYATGQRVAIWAWVDSKELREPAARAAYFARMRDVGVVGVKIDFMKPADVEWTRWYDETIRAAAGHELMLNFHGALRPTGRERTWPNDVTREAVGGREGGKRPGPHDATLPFVRYVQGPADYTPTDFRPEKLKGSSLAHELSMAVVFTSPILCYGGSPESYLASDALDVLKAIPATWDETRVLPCSAIGEVAAFARRSGDEWFLGVLNGGEARSVAIDFGFLGAGEYGIVKLGDSPDRNDAFVRAEATVTAKDSLDLAMRKDGGFVARVTPRH